MSGKTTKRMINAYYQEAAPTAFFSGMFSAPPVNFHSSEEVEIDIVRSEEDVSIAIQDMSTGYRMNSEDIYTNKGFKPPIHKEAIPINSFDLIKRMPGQNPFESPDFRTNVIMRMFNGMRKVERKIRRAIELQASQVLQTGSASLTDENGAVVYTIDYAPKASHFFTAGTAWDQAGADPIGDIETLCNLIRTDGLATADEIDMGSDAYEAFIKNEDVQKRLDLRRADLGSITPMQRRGNGGIYRGTVEIGNYKLDIFTYDGHYKNPQTKVTQPYLAKSNVVVRTSDARMDATFGAIPNIGRLLGGGRSLIPEMPGRLSSTGSRMDLHTNIWMSPDGENLFGGVGARPLMIPTAIDTFGCIDTGL